MATKFEEIINGMVNVGFGAAAVAAEKSKAVISDLEAKGEQARRDIPESDFVRSVADTFTQAGGTVSEVTERLATKGEGFAEKVLDELVLMRARSIPAEERPQLIAHLTELIEHADEKPAPAQEEVEVEHEVHEEPQAQDEPAAPCHEENSDK
ncbi:hypothetical protein K6V98_07840 [Collinsella sp. AGMB00827]|uniref:Poly(Hydroxyalcanoate) granule associated protein (Phasin) n=1 Tax=Collinsella ureilytica TaxID=2869515 RepID=A0ABS7MLL3_9ACTN|nr:hypothetical protein [Collinsella urealyticum]MBY4798255.1 hypothetical protein [Collinsella urealyticum]